MSNYDYDGIDKRVSSLEERTDIIENRLNGFEYANQQLRKALNKIYKNDFSWASDDERNWLIVAMNNFLQWQRKKIAEIVNLSPAQVGNIVNNYVAEYSL